MAAAPKLGMNLSIATPQGFEPAKTVVDHCLNDAVDNKTNLMMTHKPLDAVKDADVIVTDTWISMGQEEEKAQRLKDFKGYQVRFI